MIFKSKIDPWLVVVFFIATIIPITLALTAIQTGEKWIFPILISGLVCLSFFWLLTTTKYMIDNETLIVQSGPFRWNIPKNEITQVTPSKSVVSSPALSLDRLRVEYAQGQKSILISPKDKNGFLRAVGVTANAA